MGNRPLPWSKKGKTLPSCCLGGGYTCPCSYSRSKLLAGLHTNVLFSSPPDAPSPLRVHPRMPPKQRLPQQRPTNPLIWLLAIICAFLAVAVIVTGIFIFAIYMLYQPKMPYIKISGASLDSIDYDQSGSFGIHMSVTMEAVNDNARAHASFADYQFSLRFRDVVVAQLVAEPFDVLKNSSRALRYSFDSAVVPLDQESMDAVNGALQRDLVAFNLKGQARTRWRVGVFVSVKLWTHLACDLVFAPSNHSSIGLKCSSKSR